MLNKEKYAHPVNQVSGGAGNCRKVVFATWSPPEFPGCFCRPQLDQGSCGALVKVMIILAKYWLCHSAFLLTELIRCAEYVCSERKDCEL